MQLLSSVPDACGYRNTSSGENNFIRKPSVFNTHFFIAWSVRRLYAIFQLFIMRKVAFGRNGAYLTGNGVTIWQNGHGFLFVFRRHLPSICNCFEFINAFQWSEVAECQFRPLWGSGTGSDVNNRFLDLQFCVGRTIALFVGLLPLKSYSTLSLRIDFPVLGHNLGIIRDNYPQTLFPCNP